MNKKEYQKQWYQKNKEHANHLHQLWVKNNPDKIKNIRRKDRQRHPERVKKWNDYYGKIYGPIRNPKRILFKGKVIYLNEKPRTGICKKCGRSDILTNIHHIQYHDDDPLKDTVELCASCHNKESRRLGQIR